MKDGAPYDVAVIGLGPTGATLACLLAQCGLSVLVLEREPKPYPLPRAVHFDGETMRVFQTVGITGLLEPRVHVNPGMRFVDPSGRLLMDWPRPQEIGPHGWHESYRFHQPELEDLLRRRLEVYPQITVRQGHEVTQVDETADRVTLTVNNCRTDTIEAFEASYVVGCDGANSFIRDAMAAELEDLGFQERWLVLDLILKRPMPGLGDHTLQVCDPARPTTYCRAPGMRRRWEISLRNVENEDEMTDPDHIWAFLRRWLTPEDADLERKAIYTFRSAVARQWRKGRMMIAGDAAHLTPPFMGQGMCAGIRDASNLAWKLALVVQDRADPALLDSYGAERAPHARAYIETAVRLGGLINSLDRHSALAMAQQDDAGRATMASIAPRLGNPVPDGPDDPHRGRIFGQPRLSDGRLLDDAVGYAPALLTRTALPMAQPNEFNAQDHPEIATHLDVLGVDAALIRPDRYVLATAQGAGNVSALRRIALPSPQ